MAASSHLRAWDKTPPSLHGGDEAEVLEHMLLAEEARGHLSAVRLPDDDLAEDLLPEEDPERRVQHRAVAHVEKVRLHLVKPLVPRVLVAGDAAEAAGAGLGVVVRVGHGDHQDLVAASHASITTRASHLNFRRHPVI